MRKGWFIIPGVQDGDRTLEQQIKGLDKVEFAGKSVLELGCAEGLMSRWMIERGAKSVDGIDVVADHVNEAWRQCEGLNCRFLVMNLDTAHQVRWRSYDIVMALAVLHKLKFPEAAARKFASICRETMIVRLPPKHAPNIIDARSALKVQRIGDAMRESGFTQDRVTRAHLDEWTGIYVRAP